jgi:hypothetical protein
MENEPQVPDSTAKMKEALEMMRESALLRISMLKEGRTLHDGYKRAYYLQEYQQKVSNLDKLIRRLTLRVVP